MSGGVDSSLSAALLKEEGYNVIGVFIKTWHPPFMECPWKEDRVDAMRIAQKLDIPFKTIDLSKEYKKEVIDYMLSEYKKGRTPNPDVMCNKHIKFGGFFSYAEKEGADFVATGHYARMKRKGKETMLLRGKEKNKDQSYFLWTIKKRQLSKTLFPVGNFAEKKEVREEAKKRGLVTAEKKDSQGLCFIGKLDFKAFLKQYIKQNKGNVVNREGETIGTHDGVVFYTVGERRGFTILKKTPHDKPYYIVQKNIKKNELVVATEFQKKEFLVKEVILSQTNWIVEKRPPLGGKYHAQVRYRQKPIPCSLVKRGGRSVVVFSKPQEAVTSGQSLVLYKSEQCLGGGIISR